MNEIQNLNLIVTEVIVVRRKGHPDSIGIKTTLPSQYGYPEENLSLDLKTPYGVAEIVLNTMGLKMTELITIQTPEMKFSGHEIAPDLRDGNTC